MRFLLLLALLSYAPKPVRYDDKPVISAEEFELLTEYDLHSVKLQAMRHTI